jgi:hypothetical protein
MKTGFAPEIHNNDILYLATVFDFYLVVIRAMICGHTNLPDHRKTPKEWRVHPAFCEIL